MRQAYLDMPLLQTVDNRLPSQLIWNMENIDYYKKLIRLLSARIEEMKEEKRLVNKLLAIYRTEIERLEEKEF